VSRSTLSHNTVPHRIALYLPSLRGGGAERVMVNLANGFVSLGHQVDLVLVKAEGPYIKDVDSQVRIVDLGSTRVLYSLFPLMRYMRENKPDGLLSALNHANIIAIFARLFTGSKTKLVVSEHSTIASRQRQYTKITGLFVPFLMRLFYRFADSIVAVSNGAAGALANLLAVPPSSITVIYNPVITERVLALASEPLRHPWITQDHRPFILSVGRLNPAKDYPILLRAFAELRKKMDVRLVILGEGELRANLEALARELGIEDHILMPGFVDNPYCWMRSCGVFVLSSAWEGLPTVLIEAMARGAPVVATDCPSGPAEILEGGRWGRLVPVGDAVALAEAMAAALCDECHPGVEARAAEFGVNRALDGYLQVLIGEVAPLDKSNI
jgi:glycosyltransferase involved in cell wall biosynthesis